MSGDRLRLAIAQMTSTDDVQSNLAQVRSLYLQACEDRADLVAFPENTLFFRIQAGSALSSLDWEGAEVLALRQLVDQHSAALMLTTPVSAGGGKALNTTVVFRPGLAPEKLYVKVHLFDVDVEGAPPVRESDQFVGGAEARTWEFDGWTFGLSICYDLRFAELYLHYAQRVDVIFVPAAFLVPTGEAHWHTLLRARAIESQCYVAAPAQSGAHLSGEQVRKTFGHSLLIDPWGKILCELEETPSIRTIELDRESLNKVRRQIPMALHRRLKPG